MEQLINFLHEDPVIAFAILLAVILVVPLGFERLRLPGMIGLLFAGVVLGPNGLKILDSESQMMMLLSDIGLLYLMFVAGLEIDLEQFRRVKYRSIGFGSLTFLVPLITGIAIGRIFNFDWNAAILLGSLLASHTLLAYPIVSRLGVVNNEAVTVTIAATIFTDIGALLVLAICVGVNKGNFSLVNLLFLLGSLAVYTVVVLFGFDRAGREFFRRSGADEGNQFLFVLLAVFLASFGAELVGVEKIVGAFLVGLAVNDVLGESSVKEKVLFVGNVLFIPIFFVDIGLIVDIPAFISSLSSIWLSLAMTVGLIASKFGAALGAKLLYRYNWREMLTMWSLSLPQVAATLAAALVAQQAGIVSEEVLNGVIVMLLVTVILSPLIVRKTAPGLSLPETNSKAATELFSWKTGLSEDEPFTVIVPVYNPETERYLIEMAALLTRHEGGRIVPLSIVTDNPYMEASQVQTALSQSEELLEKAIAISEELDVSAQPLLRIDDNVAQGITRASQEQKASLIIMGWGQRAGLRTRLFGSIIDRVFSTAHCPVAATRLLTSPTKIRRILVPVENDSPQVVRKIYFTQILAHANDAEVTLLQVCDRRLSGGQKSKIESKMRSPISEFAPQTKIETRAIASNDPVRAIVDYSQQFDLVVLNSQKNITNAEGFAFNNVTNRLVWQLTCSAIVLGEA
jgi:Kef-type K+ transport system membrane component KefB/nucleotide-binding universal stress UspA family protein